MASKRPCAEPRSNGEGKSPSKKTKALDRVELQYSKERPMPIRVRPSHDFESADRPPKLPSPSKSHDTKVVAEKGKTLSISRNLHSTAHQSSLPVRVYRKDQHKSQNLQSPTKARIDKLDRREKSTRQPWKPVRVHRSDRNKSQNVQSSTNARINELDRREKSTRQPCVPVRVHSPRRYQPQLAACQPVNNEKSSSSKNPAQKFVLYCDLDGVLANFDAGVMRITGRSPNQLGLSAMWSAIDRCRTFYSDLEWMSDGQRLWSFITSHAVSSKLRGAQMPTILTGLPRRPQQAIKGKRKWCAEHLGPKIKVITCMTRNKVRLCCRGQHTILIDDSDRTCNNWSTHGGTAILHTSAETSIAALKRVLGLYVDEAAHVI